MATIVTLLRFTAIPTRVVGTRLHFSVLITPIVTSNESPPKPIPVSDVPHLANWHQYFPFPFGALPAGRLEIKVGAGPLDNATEVKPDQVKLETSWFDAVPHPGFGQAEAITLWQEIMKRAWVQPESDGQKSASGARATELLQVRGDGQVAAPGGPKLVEQARDAARKHRATLEGLGSASLSPVAAALVQARLLEQPYPAQPEERRALEEFEFLLARQERLGSAGASNATRRQMAEDASAGLQPGIDSDREFHRLLSGFGDYPALLRALGFIFDFSVENTSGLAGQFLISVRLKPMAADDVAPAAHTFVLQAINDATDNSEGATICHLHENSAAFTPVPAASTNLDPTATVFRGDRFDTVQWDLIATLRGAIREKNFQPAPGGAVAGERPPRPAFIDLTSHGVSLFQTAGSMPAEVKGALALARPARSVQFNAAWTADDLTRGYRAEVRRRTALTGPGSVWSEWKSLSSREIEYQFKHGGSLKKLFTVQDFAPLSLALAEGLQPLSGWVMQSVALSAGDNGSQYRITLTPKAS